MLPRSTIHRIIPILKKDSTRALRMKVPGFPKVYYCAFLLRDIEWFNTWASSGSIYRRRSDHTRNVYCDIRVGSYKFDQTTDGGLTDNDRERESASHVTVPIDDRDYAGLRLGLWRLMEAKFREALKDFNFQWGRRVLGRGAVVIIISDGWDRGDPALAAREMARLQRTCYRLIWLNPLLGAPEYEPLTRGMQAALPYVDDFLPVHNLASLEELADHLATLDDKRRR